MLANIAHVSVEAGRMTMEQVSYSIRQTVFSILQTLVVRASQDQLDLARWTTRPFLFLLVGSHRTGHSASLTSQFQCAETARR